MSPERYPGRPTRSWAKHERRRKAAERKIVVPQAPTVRMEQAEIFDPRIQAWERINGIIQRTFENQPNLLKLFRRKRSFFLEFFNGRYDISVGKGSARFDKLVQKYSDPNSLRYTPEFLDRAGPISMTITAEIDKMSPAKN